MLTSHSHVTPKTTPNRAPRLTLEAPSPSPEHAVQFYDDDAFLNDAVADFLAEGLAGHQPLLLIATAARIDSVQWRLASRGFDVDGAHRRGDLILLEAEDGLGMFMADGMPDEGRFHATIGREVGRALHGRNGTPARAYGEMVDLLIRDGNGAAAVRLEELWNDLARRHRLELLCAYGMRSFHRESDREAFRRICEQHGRVRPAESYDAEADARTRERQISALQQRAAALESEVRERRKLERALREAIAEGRRTEEAHRVLREKAEHASAAKSQFLAVMSHELRTPLNAIIGYQDLLVHEVGGTLTESQRRFVQRIHSAAEQLLRLIDQILSLSRIEAGRKDIELEAFDLSTLTTETVSLVEPAAVGKGLSVRVHAPNSPLLVNTDPGKVRQILLNLLSNAVKFTDEGTVEVHLALDQDVVTVHVRDSGPGVSERDRTRIFEPFVQADTSHTRRHAGTGLGLSVSRELARMLGGEVTLEEGSGAGSTFTLRLPATHG